MLIRKGGLFPTFLLCAPGRAGNSSCVMLNSGAESCAGLLTIPTEKTKILKLFCLLVIN